MLSISRMTRCGDLKDVLFEFKRIVLLHGDTESNPFRGWRARPLMPTLRDSTQLFEKLKLGRWGSLDACENGKD